jgi:hypothetical protein
MAKKSRCGTGKMDARTKWIKKWAAHHLDEFRFFDPLRDQAIANVRQQQDRELERFRESVDQDELEVQEFERLATMEATLVYDLTHTRRTRR